jgi:BirA family transcriptional regulator, biotin operon repressor / biotin---[acetyl-CoA-carboxylase] ligase
MPDRSLHWDTRALREQLDSALPGLSVEVLERTTSTNTVLLERARAACTAEVATSDSPGAEPDAVPALVRRSVESAAFGRRPLDVQACLLIAEQQTAGRGRQGRAWHSSAGASLTFSLALPLRVSDWSGLSLAVGVAVADALEPHAEPGQARIGLKWPNDLWLMDGAGAGRKLGGILIETVAAGAHRLAVIGIGLNVRPIEQSTAASDAGSGFASLHELDATASAPRVLRQVALPLVLALQRFQREGFAAFCDRFVARDLLRGQAVRTTQPDAPEGVAQGVSAQGALLVQTAAGMKPVTSGEVSVRLRPSGSWPAASLAGSPAAPLVVPSEALAAPPPW